MLTLVYCDRLILIDAKERNNIKIVNKSYDKILCTPTTNTNCCFKQ